jgi:TolB-like protein/DNA-binding winged helix-turn-helix (wHTH) protein/Tfp pilus assembly protein PilF
MMQRCRFGLFEFDFRSGELRREGQLVKLAPQPARVLACLLARPGEIVLREELRDHLWGTDTFVDFERGLNFSILQVRTALGDSSENPRFVQTVPRKGYRFIAPVSLVVPAVPQSAEAAVPPPSSTMAGRRPLVRQWLPLIAALVLVAPLPWLLLVRGSSPATVQPDLAVANRIRVAVLPFVNLTGDASADYLADGLTDEVISQLGRLGLDRVAVIARTSAMSYRNTTKSVAQIGRELNAGFIVESSIRREDGALRIAASLVPVADEAPTALWSETFGGVDTASADSQTGAAIRLARLIALRLLPGHEPPPLSPATINLAAWDALIQGNALMNRGTSDDVRRAIAAFESAVQRDVTLAAGWARLAAARHQLVMMGAAAPTEQYPRAQQAADRALASDSSLPDAHVARGLVQLWYDWRPAEAAASFERALALNTSSPEALHDSAWAFVALGRDAEAVARITAARDLDPISTRANNDIGWLYLQLRQPAEAMRACRHTLAIQAESLEAQACLERAYVQRGMTDAALGAARATLPAEADAAVRSAGRPAADTLEQIWRWRLARLQDAAKTRWISPYTLATHFAMVGDTARALDQLEAAAEQRAGMLVFLERDPAVDSLRREPRFQALVARLTEARR